MVSNQAPSIDIIDPEDGFTIMETLPIEIRAVISDDLDSNSELQIIWRVTIGQTEMQQLSGEWNNITDLQAGTYVLTLEVTDTQGMMSSASSSFTITLLDSNCDPTSATYGIPANDDSSRSVAFILEQLIA